MSKKTPIVKLVRKPPINNLVAKHSAQLNRPATHKDRKNDHQRKPKHRPHQGDFFVLLHPSYTPYFGV